MIVNVRIGEHVLLWKGGMCRWVEIVNIGQPRNGNTVIKYKELTKYGRAHGINETELDGKVRIEWGA